MNRDPEFGEGFEGLGETGRRQLLKAMGASLSLAGLSACSSDQPDQRALPYVRAPEFMVPNQARHYATAVATLGGYAQPVLGSTQMGRPTKLEGLPGHLCSQGAADAFAQASILGLYDPGRSQSVHKAGQISDWNAFDAAMTENARRLDATGGAGLRLLTAQETSPTLIRQVEAMRARWPGLRWHMFEPAGDEDRRAAARASFGRPLDALPRLDLAEVVVSLDDDLLGPGPQQTRNGRLWSLRRQGFQRGDGQSLLFCAEPTPSLTGVAAQGRLAIAHARIALLTQALAARFDLSPAPQGLTDREAQWVQATSKALAAAHGKALVTAGAQHPAAVQALAWRITETLGGIGTTLELRAPAAASAERFEALVADLRAGEVETLIILGANPVYAAPADLGFAQAMGRARLSIHAGLHLDETARAAHWHAPIEHDLETWSDARAVDGTASLIQPLVRPFYPVRSRHALLEAVQGRPNADAHALVQDTWRQALGADFDRAWR
ncbi:MAG TPA: hypothetical protein VFN88_06405, partial [Caulobacteraceae bacterium]|nr:hypothetical protein [Caulobacteraceae bacterium]